MRGICGLSGWQWLFMLEGLFTILCGFIFLFLFPRSTARPVSLAGVRFFSERESQILTQRVLRDDPSKFQPHKNVSLAEVKATVRCPRSQNLRRVKTHTMTLCSSLTGACSHISSQPSLAWLLLTLWARMLPRLSRHLATTGSRPTLWLPLALGACLC